MFLLYLYINKLSPWRFSWEPALDGHLDNTGSMACALGLRINQVPLQHFSNLSAAVVTFASSFSVNVCIYTCFCWSAYLVFYKMQFTIQTFWQINIPFKNLALSVDGEVEQKIVFYQLSW